MEHKPKITNLTEMSLNAAILKMALPTTGWMLIQSFYHLVDAFWVGKLGAIPFAASSAASFLIWMLFSFADISGIAANTLVSQSIGAKRDAEIPLHVHHCVITAIASSLILAAIFIPSSDALFGLLGLEPAVVQGAKEYLLPWLLGMPLIFVVITLIAIFRGTGDAKTPMILMAIAVTLNGIADPFFIFGWGPFPALGLKGAAWVSVGSHAVLGVIAFIILARRKILPSWQGLPFLLPEFKRIKRILSIGMPIALNGALFAFVYIGLTWVIAKFGSTAIAAIGLGHKIEALPWFISYGFSIAAATLVGQYLGAGRTKDAERAVWRALLVAALMVGGFVVVTIIWAEQIVRFFIDDADVVATSAIYLRIVAACWMVALFDVVLEGAFSGAGNTLPPLLIGVPLTISRIPLAYLLAVVVGWGVTGVWWAIGMTSIIKGLLMLAWFMKGNWKRVRLAA